MFLFFSSLIFLFNIFFRTKKLNTKILILNFQYFKSDHEHNQYIFNGIRTKWGPIQSGFKGLIIQS